MADKSTPLLSIRLFGPFEARVNGAPLPRLRTRKGEALLALLTLRAGRAVERDWLAGALWPDSAPRAAFASLRNCLLDLRHTLGPAAARLQAPNTRTLCLQLAAQEADVLAFDAAVACGDPASLEEAVRLYRGPLLEGSVEEWAFQERQVREQAHLAALENLAAGAMARGEAGEAERHLRRAVAVDPLRETAYRALMGALAAGENHAAALQIYRELRLRLHRELNAEPDPATSALYQEIRAEARRRMQSRPPTTDRSSSSPSRRRIPRPLTRLIGREREAQGVKAAFAGARLVTLTGAGGVGKTRLAIQVAEDVADDYADGAWFVELAALADPALVPQSVAAILEVREQPGCPIEAALQAYLRPKHLLLVLDNCEHLVDACARLAEALLRECPHLQILVTSRESLRLTGEVSQRVPSLAFPDPAAPNASSPEALLGYDAVRLFVERAAAARPDFALDDRNARAVGEICRRLDGIPLATELAAARVKALPIEQIAARMEDAFRLLTGGSRTALPRHQTLRATLDWSCGLLTEPQRVLLRRLSVFAGGWTLEAAEAVCGEESMGRSVFGIRSDPTDPTDRSDLTPFPNTEHRTPNTDVLDLLTQLVERSLVEYAEEGAEARYRLLETVRQYSRGRLQEAGEAEAVRDRHRDWFVALAERAAPHTQFGAQERAWMERLEREHDNLRAALAWCQATAEGREAGMRAAAALTWFWVKRAHLAEGWQHTTRLLAAGSEAPVAARGKALVAAMRVALFRDDYAALAPLVEEGLSLGREAGDPWLTAVSLYISAVTAQSGGNPGRAQALAEEGVVLAREIGDRYGMAGLLQVLARVAEQRCDYEGARMLHQERLDLVRSLEDTAAIADGLMNLGWLARHEGNNEQAKALWCEALVLRREIGERSPNLQGTLRSLAGLALDQGDPDTARAHFEEALALARQLDNKPSMAGALLGLARVAQAQGDLPAARARLEEAQTLDQGENTRMDSGRLLIELGDYAAARSCYEAGLVLRRVRGDAGGTAWALLEVGHAAWLQGEAAVTQAHALEALGRFQEREDREGVLAALESLAVAALGQERNERAARLLGAVEAAREALKLPGPTWWRRARRRMADAVRAASLEQAFAAASAEEPAMPLEDVIRYALEEKEPS